MGLFVNEEGLEKSNAVMKDIEIQWSHLSSGKDFLPRYKEGG